MCRPMSDFMSLCVRVDVCKSVCVCVCLLFMFVAHAFVGAVCWCGSGVACIFMRLCAYQRPEDGELLASLIGHLAWCSARLAKEIVSYGGAQACKDWLRSLPP